MSPGRVELDLPLPVAKARVFICLQQWRLRNQASGTDSYVILGNFELFRAGPISAGALWRGIVSELVTAACGWRLATHHGSIK